MYFPLQSQKGPANLSEQQRLSTTRDEDRTPIAGTSRLDVELEKGQGQPDANLVSRVRLFEVATSDSKLPRLQSHHPKSVHPGVPLLKLWYYCSEILCK